MMVSTMEQIQTELEQMQTYLELPFDDSSGDAVVERALNLEQIMARSGKLCADAEYHRDNFLGGEIVKTIKEALNESKWPPSITAKKIDAMARDYNFVCKWAERVNRTTTHSHQFCITLISKLKEEMKLGNR